jgi:hypothetical protein
VQALVTNFSGCVIQPDIDIMATKTLAFRAELVYRESDVPYFAGKGGVTSQTGLTTTPLNPSWRPDLVKSKARIIFAMLYRL